MTNFNKNKDKEITLDSFKKKISKEVADSKKKNQTELERVKSENVVLKQFLMDLVEKIKSFI